MIRVNADRAPRAVLIKGRGTVRRHGRNAVADRTRLAQLFGESPASADLTTRATIQVPLLQRNTDTAITPDFIVRTGPALPVSDAATWRPLSDRGVDLLIAAVDGSAITTELLQWCDTLGYTTSTTSAGTARHVPVGGGVRRGDGEKSDVDGVSQT